MQATELSATLKPFQPQAIEAEQALLGAILRDGECLGGIIEILGSKRSVFYDPSHQLIFDTCLSIFKENKPVDLITVIDRLQVTESLAGVGGREYLLDLSEGASLSVNSTFYARVVKEKGMLRELIQAGKQIIDVAQQATDLQQALDEAQQSIFSLLDGQGNSGGLTALENITGEAMQLIEERFDNQGSLMGVSTGFRDLNEYTSGLQRSDLIVVAARPSMGKTAFCLNIAEHIGLMQRIPVAVFSLEMSKQQLVHRLICSYGNIDSQRLRTGNLRIEDWKTVQDAVDILSETPIYIDDSPMLTVMDARTKARRLKAECKDLGLIIIDYIQLMQGGRSDNRVQEISEISRGLKTLARELNVPIIALSQLSRGVEARHNKRPMLSDLRESGAIEQDADLVMFLYRHEYYEPDDVDHRGECEVIIAKQRNGPVGTVKLVFNGATTRFKDRENL